MKRACAWFCNFWHFNCPLFCDQVSASSPDKSFIAKEHETPCERLQTQSGKDFHFGTMFWALTPVVFVDFDLRTSENRENRRIFPIFRNWFATCNNPG